MRAICYDKSIVTDLDLPSSQLQAIEQPNYQAQNFIFFYKLLFSIWFGFISITSSIKSFSFFATSPDN